MIMLCRSYAYIKKGAQNEEYNQGHPCVKPNYRLPNGPYDGSNDDCDYRSSYLPGDPWINSMVRRIFSFSDDLYYFPGNGICLSLRPVDVRKILADEPSCLRKKNSLCDCTFDSDCFFSTVFYQGIAIMQTVHTQISPAMRIPMSLPYSAMMVGSILAVINCLYLFVFHIFNVPVSFSPEDKEGPV